MVGLGLGWAKGGGAPTQGLRYVEGVGEQQKSFIFLKNAGQKKGESH